MKVFKFGSEYFQKTMLGVLGEIGDERAESGRNDVEVLEGSCC